MRYWCGSISGSGGFGWLPALAVIAAAAWYGASALLLHRRGGSWPLGRAIWAGIGVAVAVAVTQGPVEGLAMQRFSFHSVQHVACLLYTSRCV